MFGHDYRQWESWETDGNFNKFWHTGGGLDSNYCSYEGEWEINVKELPEQFRKYYKVLDNMYLSVEYYNEDYDRYETATMYHTDLKYKPVIYQGQRMIEFQQFSLIEH